MKGLFRRGNNNKSNNKSTASPSSSSTTSSSQQIEISAPFNVRLEHHVDFDREFGLSGVPKDWDLSSLQGIHFTVDDVNNNNNNNNNNNTTTNGSHSSGLNGETFSAELDHHPQLTSSGSPFHHNTNGGGGDSSPSLSSSKSIDSIPPALNTSSVVTTTTPSNNSSGSPSLSMSDHHHHHKNTTTTTTNTTTTITTTNNNSLASPSSSSFFSKLRGGSGSGNSLSGSFMGKNKQQPPTSPHMDVAVHNNNTGNGNNGTNSNPESPSMMVVTGSNSSLNQSTPNSSTSQPPSLSQHEHSKSASQGFFAKIFTKTNSAKTVSTPSEQSATMDHHVNSSGQFVMNFTNVKRTEAGYYVEVGNTDTSSIATTLSANVSKFKKDKLLIDLISHENPFRLFTKMKKIGTGSTADVYKAIHVPSGKKVAIKVMPLTTSKNTNFDMIENEIFMMKHACKSYSSIFDYDATLDKTLMVQYFGTYSTVNCQVHEHIGRYLSDSKRRKLQQQQEQNSSQQQTNSAVSPNSSNGITTTIDMDTMLEYKEKSHDELWVTMEYVSGGKLTDLIGDNNVIHHRFLESEIAAILIPILKCLHLLHTKYGVIHRDIKSDNVLITRDGKIKLADYGFCAENTGRRRSVVGTPYWMSPEVVSGAEYNEKTDVWSLGILILELANGTVPLMEHTPIRALFLIRSQPPPTFTSSSEWSDVFHEFLSKCLEKDPQKRASVEELLQHDFLKNASSLDFLPPLLNRIRAEKKKRNIKESEIGLQVVKLRNSQNEQDESYDQDDEYETSKRKKKGIGIMGVVMNEQPSSRQDEEEYHEYSGVGDGVGGDDLQGDGTMLNEYYGGTLGEEGVDDYDEMLV
ncbi:hypothetical protein C9374_007130 [Naegleria lovaniensis]|uniref:non-specific serine/threonine protein kinase n=1 Tax=Naegleria lovaniensis TaxID=51637 RepID=A0AA88GZR7_NAELO|nr:uncharacterized protein C9374_007130 [Naegleria lovaniensis]KAG2393599.1 hypothetical protein C9374_007130 [Naegleria lovaniensis]